MSTSFTEKEIAYLKSQPLGRLATVSDVDQPDAVAVGFEFDGQHFYVGGHNLSTTRKYKNIAAGHTKVALLIDDLPSVNPWSPRGIRVYGTAEIVEHVGRLGAGAYIRISPFVSWSWNIEVMDSQTNRFGANKTIHAQSA